MFLYLENFFVVSNEILISFLFFLAVNYKTSLMKSHHFGFKRGLNGGIQLRFYGSISCFTLDRSNDEKDRLSSCSPSTLREVISDAT